MKQVIIFILSLLLVSISCDQQKGTKKSPKAVEKLPYTWEALKSVPVPTWFEDAKFGIFIHWGPYAVPGWSDGKSYSEWYSTRMYWDEEWVNYHAKTYGIHFGYKDFVPMFKAENYDAKQWAEILKASGAKYVIPTAEHHDGFAMWDTDLTPWNSVEKGPKLDFIGTLSKAVTDAGLKFGISYHRERHWAFYTSTVNKYAKHVETFPAIKREIKENPEAALLYGPFGLTEEFMKGYTDRFQELCEKYHPDFMWLDDAPSTAYEPRPASVDKFMNFYQRNMLVNYVNMSKEWGKEVYWNNKRWKTSNYPPGVGVDEKDYLRMDNIPTVKWQSSGGMAHSYGYDRTEESAEKYKSVENLVETLIDVVSKNGNFLLDIGPKSDGTITPLQEERLRGVGDWLGKYGECIYGTRPWITFGYDNVRFTKKGNVLYAIFFEKPVTETAIKLTGKIDKKMIQSIKILNGNITVDWRINENGNIVLSIREMPPDEHVYVVKISMSSENNRPHFFYGA